MIRKNIIESISALNKTVKMKFRETNKKIDQTNDKCMQALYEVQENILKKINIPENNTGTEIHIANNEKYAVVETDYNYKRFLWVCRQDANDFVSVNAKQAKICMDPYLYSMFYEKQGTFLDLGANIGAFSLPFAAQGWKGYAFEAGTNNADVLRKSVGLNGFDIQVIEQAVYDKTGSIRFVENGPWGMVENDVMENEKYVTLDAIALDDWYVNVDIQQIDLVKIDIEGSEVAALRGMKGMLKKFHYPLIYTEVNLFTLALQGETQYSYFTEAEEMGYRIYELYEGKLYEYSKDIFPVNYCRDYIFLNEIPGYLKNKVFEKIVSNEGRLEQVLQRLKNYKNWPNMGEYSDAEEQYDCYICFCIKDYPEILTDEIRTVLSEIKENMKNHVLVQKFLSWMENED